MIKFGACVSILPLFLFIYTYSPLLPMTVNPNVHTIQKIGISENKNHIFAMGSESGLGMNYPKYFVSKAQIGDTLIDGFTYSILKRNNETMSIYIPKLTWFFLAWTLISMTAAISYLFDRRLMRQKFIWWLIGLFQFICLIWMIGFSLLHQNYE